MLQQLEKIIYIFLLSFIFNLIKKFIPEEGLEPSPIKRQEPKPCTSTNSVTLAMSIIIV